MLSVLDASVDRPQITRQMNGLFDLVAFRPRLGLLAFAQHREEAFEHDVAHRFLEGGLAGFPFGLGVRPATGRKQEDEADGEDSHGRHCRA